MKHMFIRYCEVTDEYRNATMDERKDFLSKTKKSAKEHGFEMTFWGGPWGVPESLALVFKSEKSLDGFVEWLQATGPLGLPAYIESSRTITITMPPQLEI
jgi:hypothetical protein